MARVTVEDCLEHVHNRFDLVLLAAHRARAISAGADLRVDRDNDKNPVVALREIADEKVNADELREALVSQLQRVQPIEEAEEEAEVLAIEKAAPVPDISEEDLLRALQNERDASGDGKF